MKRKPTIEQLMQKIADLRPNKNSMGDRSTKRATDFMVWRAGSSVSWQCTSSEISDETGLSSSAVQKICRRKGWKLVHNASGLSRRRSIDTIIAHPGMMNGGAT
jgi:hypothetical protein